MMKMKVTMDDFSFVSCIGKGSYADVSLVRKKDTGKLYAMKALKKKFVAQKKQQNNVMLQKNILLSVDHPFIVKLSYSFQNDRKLFFILEYCPGGDLFGLLCKRKRLTQQQVRMNAAQIVLALEYLHSKNIVYRDLKPQNVILDSQGYLRLTDFGLSRVQLGEKALNICGTPEYIAPQVLYKQGASKPADWWCLGCIIYEMSVGLPPFYMPTSRQQLFEKIKSKQPKYIPALSPNLKALIQALLVKNPQQRLCSRNGSQQIKNHVFFQGLDWNKLYKKQLKPQFKPKLQGQVDTSNFEKQFTECQANQFSCSPMSNQDNNYYDGFSCNKSGEHKIIDLQKEQNLIRRRSDNDHLMDIQGNKQNQMEQEVQFQIKMDLKQEVN